MQLANDGMQARSSSNKSPSMKQFCIDAMQLMCMAACSNTFFFISSQMTLQQDVVTCKELRLSL